MKKLFCIALLALSLTACGGERVPYALASVQATLDERCANYGGVRSVYLSSFENPESVQYTIKYDCQNIHTGTLRLTEAKR